MNMKQTILVTGASSGIGLLIARMITKPLNDIKNLMETAKDGDFQVQGTYESNDEIGFAPLLLFAAPRQLDALQGQRSP